MRASLDTSDANELNNSPDTATPLSENVTAQGAIYGYIAKNVGDTDYYAFTAPSAGNYNLVVSNIPEEIIYKVDVLNSQNVTLKYDYVSNGEQFVAGVAAEANEKFYLKVERAGGTYTPKKYNVVAKKP